jgi:hypothetical protein
VELGWIEGVLESFTSVVGSFFHFQMLDLSSFLIDVKYLEIESMNPKKILSCWKLGFVLKVDTCHYNGVFFPENDNGLKINCFHHF